MIRRCWIEIVILISNLMITNQQEDLPIRQVFLFLVLDKSVLHVVQ